MHAVGRVVASGGIEISEHTHQLHMPRNLNPKVAIRISRAHSGVNQVIALYSYPVSAVTQVVVTVEQTVEQC